MLQFLYRFGFDLPHPFPSDFENAAYFFQSVGVTVAQAVAQADDFALTVRERFQQRFNLLPKQAIARRVNRAFGAGIFNEFAETGVFTLADGPIQANRDDAQY